MNFTQRMTDSRRSRTSRLLVLLLLSLLLTACVESKQTSSTAMKRRVITVDPTAPGERQAMDNMVDERYELLCLIWRLVGRSEYRDMWTDYQNKITSAFAEYRDHAAVRYAASLPVGYDAVFNYAVHIYEEDGRFRLLDDIDSLINDGTNRWNAKTAEKFLALLNDFYLDTNFAAYYEANIPFYQNETRRFIEQTYGAIDLEWFDTYVDAANLRCVYTPSNSRHNYGALVNGSIVYCAVSSEGSAIVHEFCHSFANPIADTWYAEDETFRHWCDDSVDLERYPQYSSGLTMAGEYVTRAYTILYEVEHGQEPQPLLQAEKRDGFPYIEDVYALITAYEKAEDAVGSSASTLSGRMQWNATETSSSLKAAEISDLRMMRLDPPQGLTPLGMLSERYGYLVDRAAPEALWLFDYQQRTQSAVIDYRATGLTLATELAFNERWLIWIELGAYQQSESGGKVRRVRLLARDLLSSDAATADTVLASGSNTPAEGFYLPFDSLCLSGNNLVYRYSIFDGGQRDTEVRLHNLGEGSSQTLDRREFANQEQILQCSLSEQFAVWDVQRRYRSYPSGLPDWEQATYSLLVYDLSKAGNTTYRREILTAGSVIHAPLVRQGTIYALYRNPPKSNWVNIAPDGVGKGIYRWKSQGIKAYIVTLSPALSSMAVFVGEYGYAAEMLQEFTRRDIPLAIEYSDIRLGKRLLSWQSNIGDTLFVYDLQTNAFIELPYDFVAGEETVQDLCVEMVPGLDADYLYFSLMTGSEAAYILRIE